MSYIVNGKTLSFSEIQIMGILNFTPDSFFDGGKYFAFSKAIDYVDTMVQLGANFIDIGGESFRPGSVGISEDEELSRVIPIVSEVSKRFDVFISVNTSRALVMRESAKVGADLINDIRSLNEPDTIEVMLSYPHLSICLMHMQGCPETMQRFPYYCNVVKEVNNYFIKQINRCKFLGIDQSRLLIDPGFGFGKTVIHNYQLLAHLMDFHHFKLPLVVGISRKSMLDLLGNQSPDKRMVGSIASSVIAAMQGVQILRVHDVKETLEAIQVVRAMLQWKDTVFYEAE